MVEGSDYYWGTNNNSKVMCLTKSGYLKIVKLKLDWAGNKK